MPTVAVSLSVRVIVSGETVKRLKLPVTSMLSSPSTTVSSTGVMVSVPSALVWPLGMVMLASDVAV